MGIQVPNFGSSRADSRQPGISEGDAVKPWLALSRAGGEISEVGDDLHEHNMRIMEVENAADVAEFKNRAQTLYADRQRSFAEDHDYSSYKEKWEGDLNRLENDLDGSEMSEAAREKARLFLENFKGGSRIGVAGAVQRKAIERGKQAFANGVNFIRQNYDPSEPGAARAQMADLLGDQPWMTPEDKEGAMATFDQFAKEREELSAMQMDPRGYLEKNKEPDGDPVIWEQNRRKAQGILNRKVREQADEVMDLIYGPGTITPDMVEALTPDMGEEGRAALRDAITAKASEAMTNRMAMDPDYRNQVTGEIAELVRTYRPNGTDFDEQYVGIRSRIEMLPSGPLKSEYIRQLNGIREGKERELKTVRDWTVKQVEEAYESGSFGAIDLEEPEGKALGAYLDDGLLSDAALLQDFGFSEEVAEDIANLEEKGKRTEAIEKLRTEWDKSNARSEDFPPDKGAALDALRDHKGNTHKVKDPARLERFEREKQGAKDEAARKYGAAMEQVSEFLELNPDVPMPKAAEFLEKLKIDVEAGETNSSWLPTFSQYRGIGKEEDYLYLSDPSPLNPILPPLGE